MEEKSWGKNQEVKSQKYEVEIMKEKNGGGATEEKSWKRNHGGKPRRRNHGGAIMEEQSWSSNHGGAIMEDKSWRRNPEETSCWARGAQRHPAPRRRPDGIQRHPGSSQGTRVNFDAKCAKTIMCAKLARPPTFA